MLSRVLQRPELALDATDPETAGDADRIDPGQNGFIHRAGDVDDLAAQLAMLLRDPGLAAQMGPKAAARAAEWPLERGVRTIRALFRPT